MRSRSALLSILARPMVQLAVNCRVNGATPCMLVIDDAAQVDMSEAGFRTCTQQYELDNRMTSIEVPIAPPDDVRAASPDRHPTALWLPSGRPSAAHLSGDLSLISAHLAHLGLISELSPSASGT